MLTGSQLRELNAVSEAELDSLLKDGSRRDVLREYFGQDQYERLRELAEAPAHFGGGSNIILLPGIMGSELTDVTGRFGKMWIDLLGIALGADFKNLGLDNDGLQDRTQGLSIKPSGLVRSAYLLPRKWLAKQGHTVAEFPFDWRRSIDDSAQKLHDFIEALAAGDRQKRFVLIAHSMGGLVSRRYLALCGTARVGKLIMLATPNHGSYAPPMAMTVDYPFLKVLSFTLGKTQAEGVVTTFPGLYEMFPDPAVFGQPALYNKAFFGDPSVSDVHLSRSRKFYETLEAKDTEKMVLIACKTIKTVVRVEREEAGAAVHYRYLGAKVGDGTVPFDSAYLEGVPTYLVDAGHGEIQKDDCVLRAVQDLLTEGSTTRLPVYKKPFAMEKPQLEEMVPDEAVFRL